MITLFNSPNAAQGASGACGPPAERGQGAQRVSEMLSACPLVLCQNFTVHLQ